MTDNQLAVAKEFIERLNELSIIDGEKYNGIKEKVNKLLDSGNGYFVMVLSLTADMGIEISRALVQNPRNREELENFGVFLTESRFAYTTTRYGDAYKHTWYLVCRSLKVDDRRGLEVFESINGHKFVVVETAGDAAYFGSTTITTPEV